MAKTNLDALIPREDFEVEEADRAGTKKDIISITDLTTDSFTFPYLRKPDFQRETNEWDGVKILEFLESFLDGDLIPAIILWRSPSGYIFVIDGSHRLSSLIAWINDDYGDGPISKHFYDGIIPEDQISTAVRTRGLIRRKVGSYQDFKLALTNPEKVKSDIIPRAKNLSALGIKLQWVEGDANKAEVSFFKINRQAAPINPTELTLLESRKKPNCIAARAIIRSGKGHKYWSIFSEDNQQKIQDLAKEINQILFAPPLKTPVKTLDIPIAGKIYSAQSLSLILDFVNIANDVGLDFKKNLQDDTNGEATIAYLQKARKVAWRINSMHHSSLGLHPIIYFYSSDGRHKIASFYATVAFIIELEKTNYFETFTKIRSIFETFLPKYDYLVQQIFRTYRSALNAYLHIKDFYFAIINELIAGKSPEQAIDSLLKTDKYKYLSLQTTYPETASDDFDSERKSAVYIREALQAATKCQICKGFIHMNSLTIDHIDRKEDGGKGSIDNGQIAHPYCNTTFKN